MELTGGNPTALRLNEEINQIKALYDHYDRLEAVPPANMQSSVPDPSEVVLNASMATANVNPTLNTSTASNAAAAKPHTMSALVADDDSVLLHSPTRLLGTGLGKGKPSSLSRSPQGSLLDEKNFNPDLETTPVSVDQWLQAQDASMMASGPTSPATGLQDLEDAVGEEGIKDNDEEEEDGDDEYGGDEGEDDHHTSAKIDTDVADLDAAALSAIMADIDNEGDEEGGEENDGDNGDASERNNDGEEQQEQGGEDLAGNQQDAAMDTKAAEAEE